MIYRAVIAISLLVASASLTAQDVASQLETIKAEVLSAALSEGVSVVSSAYIDASGKLVESSFYQAAGGLRGVRMPTLLLDEQSSAYSGFMETSPLNDSLECEALPRSRYARSLAISTSVMPQVTQRARADARAFTQALSLISQAIVAEVEGHQSWAVSTIGSSASPRPASLYERFSDPDFVDQRDSNHSLEIEITRFSQQELNPAQTLRVGLRGLRSLTRHAGKEIGLAIDRSAGLAASERESQFEIGVTLRLAEQGAAGSATDSKVLAQRAIKLKLSLRDGELSNAGKLNDQLKSTLQRMLGRASDALRCQPETFAVYAQNVFSDSTPTLNQGAKAGIRRGDRFLLSTRKFTNAEQLVESDMLESLAIAEVIRVHQDNAELEILEGPNTPGLHTSAMPF